MSKRVAIVSPPTIDDVASLAGVHKSTVSRALNPATAARVNVKTRERVAAAAKDLGFSANPSARWLSTGRSMTIGVLVLDIANPVSATIIKGIDDELHPFGFGALIGNTNGDPARAQKQLQRFRDRGVDGVIVGTALLDDVWLSPTLVGTIPIVEMNRRGSRDRPGVVVDAASGIRQAMDWLATAGHKAIGCIAAPKNTSTGRDRVEAFRDAYRDLLGGSPTIVHADAVNQDAGRSACLTLLKRNCEVTGILAGSDLLALGCLEALRETGKSCPDDVSLVGFDDMPYSRYFSPALSSIRFDHYEMGVESARLMMNAISGTGEANPLVKLPTQWIRRESVRALSPIAGPVRTFVRERA